MLIKSMSASGIRRVAMPAGYHQNASLLYDRENMSGLWNMESTDSTRYADLVT